MKESIDESHLQKIKEESISLAIQILKISNNIEAKTRTLDKFEKALEIDPNLPFIPNSASNFKLAASESVQGTEEYTQLSNQVEAARQIFNKVISNAAYQVGKWEREALFGKRVELIVEKGLTLSYAVEIQHMGNSPRLNWPDHPKKCAAAALLQVLTNQYTNKELYKYLHGSNKDHNSVNEKMIKLVENDFKRRGEGEFNAAKMVGAFTPNDDLTIIKVKGKIEDIINIVSYQAWNHIEENQQKRIMECNINSLISEQAIASVTRATNELLLEEKAVSHKVLDELIDSKVNDKLKNKLKDVRKNSLGARKSPARKPSKSGKTENRESSKNSRKSSEHQKNKQKDSEKKKSVSFPKSVLKNKSPNQKKKGKENGSREGSKFGEKDGQKKQKSRGQRDKKK